MRAELSCVPLDVEIRSEQVESSDSFTAPDLRVIE